LLVVNSASSHLREPAPTFFAVSVFRVCVPKVALCAAPHKENCRNDFFAARSVRFLHHFWFRQLFVKTCQQADILRNCSVTPAALEGALSIMKQWLKTLFGSAAASPAPSARIPDGERVYAIGDVHGRLDLFEALIDAVDADDAALPAAQACVILLGDLVDRGPESKGVVAKAREWQRRRKVRILMGNHEEMFLNSFDNPEMLRHFLRHGGRETLISYGIGTDAYMNATLEEVMNLMAQHIPPEERAYIEGFEDSIALGDYYFVHAGVDPATALSQQKPHQLRWIREPFLSHDEPLEKIIVHGHTIIDEPVDNGVRIGIDTGAYSSGVLTALVLEGDHRRYIATHADEQGAIAIRQDPPMERVH